MIVVMRLGGSDLSVGSLCSQFSELPLTNWKSIYFRYLWQNNLDSYLHSFVYTDLRHR